MIEKKQKVLRFYLWVPVIAIPFLGVVFWLLGVSGAQSDSITRRSGLNMLLPGAREDEDSAKDKLSMYMQAAADSAKHANDLRTDPYRTVENVNQAPIRDIEKLSTEKISPNRARIKLPTYERANPAFNIPDESVRSPKVEPASPDPELVQINETLDRLMGLQTEKGKISAADKIMPGFPVTVAEGTEQNYLGRKTRKDNGGHFFQEPGLKSGAIVATIPVTQTLQSGSVVKLELISRALVDNVQLSPGFAIYGVASLSGERLVIQVTSLRIEERIIPVHLSVYDLDGLEGIYVPGTLGGQVLKEAADGAIQSAGVIGYDPSLKAQIASAGLNATKSLLSKKIKTIRVLVEAGHRVLLFDNQKMP